MTHAKWAEFKQRVGEIHDLNAASGVLSWDLETMMPAKGADNRAQQLSTLSALSHRLMTDEAMGALLKTLRKDAAKLSAVEAALVREVGREFDRATKLPEALVQQMSEITAKAHALWVEARQKQDFKLFEPVLSQIVTLNQQMADCLGYEGSPYNALMDLYEPGLTTQTVDAVFGAIKPHLVQLVSGITQSKSSPERSFLHTKSSLDKQWQFSIQVLTAMGFDFEGGRMDKAPHPFCTGAQGDVRLTTRLFEEDLVSSLFSSMHEAGHGLYEQGVSPDLTRTPLSEGTSLGIHESQSRMWENLVGRSRPFWGHFYPRLKAMFPKQLNRVSVERFYKAINVVQPSFIRVESDEVTYNLHILLRYELERDIIEGKLKVKDIPKAWNAKMTELLGITPTNDAQGCLQDIHWAHGSFGYFPTYTLGNLYASQFFHTAQQAMPSLTTHIQRGNLAPLRAWLQEQIHQYGKQYTPDELVQRVTGESLNPQYFIDYLWQKFGGLYGVTPPVAVKKLVKHR